MKAFHRSSLRRKLVLTMMAVSSAALLVACAFFLSYDVVTFRRTLADHLHSLADITGANVAAALTYQDPKSANLVLQALGAEQHITAARVYSAQGKVFATFSRDSAEKLPLTPPSKGSRVQHARMSFSQPLLFDGENIGFVYLESDLQE